MLRRIACAAVLLAFGLSFAPCTAVASPARPIVYSKVSWGWVPGENAMREVSEGGLFSTLHGEARQLTEVAGDAQPSLAPDGGVIAFVRAGDIYTVAATGGAVHPLAVGPGEDREATFSADGKAIAFVRGLPTAGGGSNDEIYSVRPSGAWMVRLTRTPEDEFAPHYCAEGIVFDRRRTVSGGPAAILTMRRDGTRTRLLVDRGRLGAKVAAVSPNGRLLLYGSRGLWAKRLGSGSPRSRLLVERGNGDGLVFSADGRRVAGIFGSPGMIFSLASVSIRSGSLRNEGEIWELEAPGPMQTSIGPAIAW